MCGALESLQSSAPSHAPDLSVSAVEAAFSRPLRELFSAWEAEPIASGSIAQIHRWVWVALLELRVLRTAQGGAIVWGGGGVAGGSQCRAGRTCTAVGVTSSTATQQPCQQRGRV